MQKNLMAHMAMIENPDLDGTKETTNRMSSAQWLDIQKRQNFVALKELHARNFA